MGSVETEAVFQLSMAPPDSTSSCCSLPPVDDTSGKLDVMDSSKNGKSGEPQRKKIVLSNLPTGWTDAEYGHLVRDLGVVVTHHSLKRSKALYTFDSPSSAAEAVRLLNGTVVNGNAIKVEYDKFSNKSRSVVRSTKIAQNTTKVDVSDKPDRNNNVTRPRGDRGESTGNNKSKEGGVGMRATERREVRFDTTVSHPSRTTPVGVHERSGGKNKTKRTSFPMGRGVEGSESMNVPQLRAEREFDGDEEPGVVLNNGEEQKLSTIRLVLPSSRIGALIGRKGDIIRKIVMESNTTSIRALPEMFPWSEQIVEVIGQFDNCGLALTKILERECSLITEHDQFDGSEHVELRVLLPDRFCGLLIGKSGQEIKTIREETNTTIGLSKLLLQMEMYPERVMTIRGKISQVVAAESMLRAKIEELTASRERGDTGRYGQKRYVAYRSSTDMCYRIEIREQYVGRLIGENGNNIKNLITDSRAYIVVEPRLYESSHGGSYGNAPRWVSISGTPDAIFRASYAIFDFLSQCVTNKNVYTYYANTCVEIPRHLVGRIIGRNGQKVKYIQQCTGAEISVSREAYEGNEVAVHITGCFIASQKALQQIRDITALGENNEDKPTSVQDARRRHFDQPLEPARGIPPSFRNTHGDNCSPRDERDYARYPQPPTAQRKGQINRATGRAGKPSKSGSSIHRTPANTPEIPPRNASSVANASQRANGNDVDSSIPIVVKEKLVRMLNVTTIVNNDVTIPPVTTEAVSFASTQAIVPAVSATDGSGISAVSSSTVGGIQTGSAVAASPAASVPDSDVKTATETANGESAGIKETHVIVTDDVKTSEIPQPGESQQATASIDSCTKLHTSPGQACEDVKKQGYNPTAVSLPGVSVGDFGENSVAAGSLENGGLEETGQEEPKNANQD